jgi:caffeoyl-CoA O-methyltransferase
MVIMPVRDMHRSGCQSLPLTIISNAMASTIWPNDTPIKRVALLLHELEVSLTSSQISDDAKNLLAETRSIVDGFDGYLETMSSNAPDVLNPMIAQANSEDWASLHSNGKTQSLLHSNMCAGQYEAVVLQMLAKMTGAKRVLEIGMFMGTTTVSLALLPQVEKVVPMDIEPYLFELTSQWWEKAGVGHKIHPMIGDAIEGLQKLQDEKQQFDFVSEINHFRQKLHSTETECQCFIDANKNGYSSYFKSVLDLGLIAPKGIVVLDNTLYKSATYVPHKMWTAPAKSIDEMNRVVVADARVDTVMLPVRDGVTVARLKD